ncbi:Aste57867_12532 [Aphanomyces stellatus]|uniref:Aste57867_12532 protein n=1 Tax=Aphanomyces stellatus TaxID=120398 RepID=A0A485KW69_9STRA|nr:hypothetical protein As57867_012486 [Aphanomyces stellatus]VFT89383.1 Aste57867_12532 [Aphanomyces stellatus]
MKHVWTSSSMISRLKQPLGRENPLISVCACSGSVGKIHTQCLKAWIKSRRIPIRDALACELCKTSYRVTLRRRIMCDGEHACSFLACIYLVAGLMLVSSSTAVLWMVWKLSLSVKKPRDLPLLVSAVAVVAISALVALWKLYVRWMSASSVVLVGADESKKTLLPTVI